MSWVSKNLGDLFKIGSSKRVLKADWKTSGVPFYRGREITALSKFGYIDNDLFISHEHFSELSETYGVPSAEDILITAIGTIGNTYIVKENDKFYFKDASVLWLSEGRDAYSKFMDYWFKSEEFFKQLDIGNGATVDTLSISKLKSLEITLPPLSVQKQIVEKLDAAFAEIDKAISATGKNIENADSMASSYSQDVFNSLEDAFQTISLDQACIVDRGSSPRPIKKFITNKSTGINWIKIGDIAEGDKYVFNTKQKITIEGSKKSRKVEKGDLILTNSMSYGRPYITAIDGCIHDGWFVLRLKEEIVADYFYHLLSSPFVQKQFHSLAAGSVVKNISGDLLKKTKVIIPSIKKQTETIERLEQLSKEIYQIKEIYSNKLKNLTALKSSILNKAFSGELTKDAA